MIDVDDDMRRLVNCHCPQCQPRNNRITMLAKIGQKAVETTQPQVIGEYIKRCDELQDLIKAYEKSKQA